jgi:hypothetical protein
MYLTEEDILGSLACVAVVKNAARGRSIKLVFNPESLATRADPVRVSGSGLQDLTLIAREVHKAAITRDHVLSCHHQDSAMVLFTKVYGQLSSRI